MAGLFGISAAGIGNGPQSPSAAMAALLSHRRGQETLGIDRRNISAGVVTAASGGGGGCLQLSGEADVLWAGHRLLPTRAFLSPKR